MRAAGVGRAAVLPFVRSKTWYSMSPSGARRTGYSYGRTVAICKVAGTDIGEQLVRGGLVWAFHR